MGHSDYFNRKNELKVEYNARLQALKDEFKKRYEEVKLELEEKKYKEKLEKKISKLLEKEEMNKRLREKNYNRMKCDSEKYEKYLESQKKFREKYKAIKKENEKKQLIENIGCSEYRTVSVNGKMLYVTEDARFFKENGKELFGSTNATGYRTINYNGKCNAAHRLVWVAFNGEIPDKMEIDHIIPIKNGGTDELSNLKIASHKDNCNNPISVENYRIHNRMVDRSYLRKKTL